MPKPTHLFTYAQNGRHYPVRARLTREELDMLEQVSQAENATFSEMIRGALRSAFKTFERKQHHNPNIPTLGQQVLLMVRVFPDTTATDYTDNPDALAFVAQELAKAPLELELDAKVLQEGKQRPETPKGRTE